MNAWCQIEGCRRLAQTVLDVPGVGGLHVCLYHYVAALAAAWTTKEPT